MNYPGIFEGHLIRSNKNVWKFFKLPSSAPGLKKVTLSWIRYFGLLNFQHMITHKLYVVTFGYLPFQLRKVLLAKIQNGTVISKSKHIGKKLESTNKSKAYQPGNYTPSTSSSEDYSTPDNTSSSSIQDHEQGLHRCLWSSSGAVHTLVAVNLCSI